MSSQRPRAEEMRAWFDSRDIGPIATTAPQQAHLACEAFLPSRRVADVTITNRINLESPWGFGVKMDLVCHCTNEQDENNTK